jgi:hypothetical protein
MITVHHLDDSRSQRILWLLEELGEPYEIEQHRRDPVTRSAPAAGAVASASLIENWIDEAEHRAWFLYEATR